MHLNTILCMKNERVKRNMSLKVKSGNNRSLLEQVKDPSILVIPGVYDPLTARIAENCGFPAILAGGYAVSATYLGLPDMEMITPTEMLDTVRRIRAVVDLPIVADIDTGGGALLNIRRLIKGMELAGASGIQIEDQFFPKRAGLTEGRQVIKPEDMVMRLKAVTDARTSDLLIIARTDAEDLSDAIDRANLYYEHGADVLFIEDIHDRESMDRVVKEVQGPTLAVMVEGSGYPFLSIPELEEVGFDVVYYCNSAMYAATYAAKMALQELKKTGTTKGIMDKMISFKDFNELIGFDELRRLQIEYEKVKETLIK